MAVAASVAQPEVVRIGLVLLNTLVPIVYNAATVKLSARTFRMVRGALGRGAHSMKILGWRRRCIA